MSIGLVLEGGGMRGMYTAGILDILLDGDIHFDKIVGISAGALFGVNYLSKQRGRVIRYNKRFNSDKNYMGIRPLIREGNLLDTKYAYETVPTLLDPFDDETYKKSDTEFYAGVTDIATGQPEFIRVDSVFEQMDTLRASGSMPVVSQPVRIGDRFYLDGGISDSIPFEWMAAQGVDKIVVILTREDGYVKKPTPAFLIKVMERRYPKIADRMKHRHEDYNRELELLRKWEDEGSAFVIRPSESVKIGRTEKRPDKLQAVYNLGLRDGETIQKSLNNYLSK